MRRALRWLLGVLYWWLRVLRVPRRVLRWLPGVLRRMPRRLPGVLRS